MKNKLEGKFKIELKKADTGELIESREYTNIVTNGFLEILKTTINPLCIQNSISNRQIIVDYNIRNAFGGMLMFDQYLPEQADTLQVNNVLNRNTCHAGGEYAGNDNKRGTLLTQQVVIEEDKIERVWEFSAGRGNGTHRSIALTTLYGGNCGIDNNILQDKIIVDSNINDYVPYTQLSRSYNINNDVIMSYPDSPSQTNTYACGLSRDGKYYIIYKTSYNSSDKTLTITITKYKYIDYSNLKIGDYLYARQPLSGLMERSSVTKTIVVGGTNSYGTRYCSAMDAVVVTDEYIEDGSQKRFIYFIDTDSGDSVGSMAVPGGIAFSRSSNVAKIGDWVYISNSIDSNREIALMRFAYPSGNFIDTIKIPFHQSLPISGSSSMFNMSDSVITIGHDRYFYNFDGEKLSGYFYIPTTTSGVGAQPNRIVSYPLMANNAGELFLDNRCLMTVHNFDAPIVKDTTMTMTITYIIKQVDVEP